MPSPRHEGDQLERLASLAPWIEYRTRGLVRDVRIEHTQDWVVVHGSTYSPRVKEIAMLILVVVTEALPVGRTELRVRQVELMQATRNRRTGKEECLEFPNT